MSRGNVAAAPAIREHPIIFSAPMVRAILDGTKTQTRRVVTRANSLVDGRAASADLWASLDFSAAWVDRGPSPAGNPGPYLKVPKPDDESVHRMYPRVMPGDRLWVREAWSVKRSEPCEPHEREYQSLLSPTVVYAADGAQRRVRGDRATGVGMYHGIVETGRSPIHMPRWASRITLEVSAVRPERLQDIGEEDAIAEGIERVGGPLSCTPWRNYALKPGAPFARNNASPIASYASLWDSINAKRAPWESNRWVWVRSFPSLGGAA